MESGCNVKKTEWFEAKVRFGRFGKPINSPVHLLT